MRKIEEAMCAAVKERKNWELSNTRVQVCKDKTSVRVSVYLFDNRIYEHVSDTSTGYSMKTFTLAGWDTITTRNRLRALGVGVHRLNKKPHYNGKAIDKEKWYEVKK